MNSSYLRLSQNKIQNTELLAWDPYTDALADYLNGKHDATILVLRDDGYTQEMHIEEFFTRQTEFSDLECVALEHCNGRVLDVGAGAGRHSLELQRRGLEVCAIDVSPAAVDIMKKRGVMDARCGELYDFEYLQFDTLLFMMNGIGIVGSLEGLERLLACFDHFIAAGGHMIFDSWDFRNTGKEIHQIYYGKSAIGLPYPGETRYRLQYNDVIGLPINWLFIDSDTLSMIVSKNDLKCRILGRNDKGQFLAELSRPTE